MRAWNRRGFLKIIGVSADGGQTWHPARLRLPLSPYAWVIWEFEWTPKAPGVYRVLARAIDQSGRVQEAETSPAFPNGPTGLDAVVAHVVQSK